MINLKIDNYSRTTRKFQKMYLKRNLKHFFPVHCDKDGIPLENYCCEQALKATYPQKFPAVLEYYQTCKGP